MNSNVRVGQKPLGGVTKLVGQNSSVGENLIRIIKSGNLLCVDKF
jgi:hypothetical protein